MSTQKPQPESSRVRAVLATILLSAATLTGLAGTDLVLPAVPGLPGFLGGELAMAQMTLASFAAGAGLGLVAFGELGARFDSRRLLIGAMTAYALFSLACMFAPDLEALVMLRFVQGMSAACAAAVVPGMVRALYSPRAALRALGAIGSVESLAPAIAPIIGVWLLARGGWKASFATTAVLALAIALLLTLAGSWLRPAARRQGGGYHHLLRSGAFLRYALSQGFAVGALLVFVFGMPTVMTVALAGTLEDFITMQVLGITTFIFGANIANRLVDRWGAETVIFGGSLLSALGLLAMLAYGLLGGQSAPVIWLLFIPVNIGIGFRGPPGFFCALQASENDDARAAALVILFVMLLTAAGTALCAPFIALGLVPVTLAAFLLALSGLACLALLPAGAGATDTSAGDG